MNYHAMKIRPIEKGETISLPVGPNAYSRVPAPDDGLYFEAPDGEHAFFVTKRELQTHLDYFDAGKRA